MKYEDLYKEKNSTFEKMVGDVSYDQYVGLINEEIGGIQIYVHKDIVNSFTCFLAWEKRSCGFDIDDVEHEDYEGWCSLGWDVDINSMTENFKINNIMNNDVHDIVVDGFVVAKTTFPLEVERYTSLLEEWKSAHVSCS